MPNLEKSQVKSLLTNQKKGAGHDGGCWKQQIIYFLRGYTLNCVMLNGKKVVSTASKFSVFQS